MRRGLIARSLTELPDAVFDTRLASVRAAMREAQCDALIIYTNNTRPAGVSWLTGFVPYWSEALLIVPREAAPYLVAALSFRVKPWIERVSHIGQVLHTSRIGLKTAEQIATALPNASVGVVEYDGLPAGVAEDLHTGGPMLALHDASDWFAKLRAVADPAEVALARTAARIADAALRSTGAGQPTEKKLNEAIASVEAMARNLGAEEIYIATAPDLDRDCRFRRIEGETAHGANWAIRATVAYKGVWIRLVRSFGDAAIAREASGTLASAVTQLPDLGGFAGFHSWLVEGCRLTQPLEALAGSRLAAAPSLVPGSIVSVHGTVSLAGRAVAVGAPALIGARDKATSFLCDPAPGPTCSD